MSDNLTPSRQLPSLVLEKWIFSQDALASNQSAVALKTLEVSNAVSNDVTGYVSQWAGTIVGVSAVLTPASAAGAVVVTPTVNGTAVTDPSLRLTTGTNGSDGASRGAASFSAGAVIGCAVTTSNEWTGSTSDIVVEVRALVEPSGV